MTFNTLYQLMALKKEHPEELEQAKALLFVPELFSFSFNGKESK